MSREGPDFDVFTADDSPMSMRDAMSDPLLQDLSTPRVQAGDPSVDFALPEYDFSDGREKATGASFTLRTAAANQPVALIFGSYT